MSNLNQPLRGCEPFIQFNMFRQDLRKLRLALLKLENFSQKKDIHEISNNIQQVQYELKQYGIPFNQYQPLAHDDQIAKMKNQLTGLFYQNNIASDQQIINKITEILIQNLNDIDDFKKSIMQQNDDFNHILGQVEYLNYNFVDLTIKIKILNLSNSSRTWRNILINLNKANRGLQFNFSQLIKFCINQIKQNKITLSHPNSQYTLKAVQQNEYLNPKYSKIGCQSVHPDRPHFSILTLVPLEEKNIKLKQQVLFIKKVVSASNYKVRFIKKLFTFIENPI
ncbi:hypothetical protein pb186bvf_002213 [Paramecium bursaria]